MTTDRLLDVRELAELLGVHENTVYRLAAAGEIPSVRIGRRRRFFMSDVRDYLEGQRDQHHTEKEESTSRPRAAGT